MEEQIEPNAPFRIAVNGQNDDQTLHGRGLIATRAIPQRTLILEEQPLVVVDTGIADKDWGSGKKFYRDEAKGVTSCIAEALSMFSQPNLTTFRALRTSKANLKERDLDASIMEHNAYDFTNQQGPNDLLAIYPTICRINHSCVPNAMCADIEPSSGYVKLASTRDIAAGQKVTVEYINGDNFWLHSVIMRLVP